MIKKKKLGRPEIKKRDLKVSCGFRLQLWKKKKIAKKFGTFQAGIEALVNKELGE